MLGGHLGSHVGEHLGAYGGVVAPAFDAQPKRSRLLSNATAVRAEPTPTIVVVSSAATVTVIEVTHG